MKRLLLLILLLLLLAAPASAIDLKLAWNPNAEPDLAGYRIYRSTAIGGPYEQIGQASVTPEPGFTWPVPPLTEATMYFVVTAYDTAGNESGYSNEASIYMDNVVPGAPQGLQITIIIQPPGAP